MDVLVHNLEEADMAVLADKVAVVTGGSTGIGFATARAFRDEGATVFITGRRKDAVEAAAAELGASVTGVVCDASVPSELDAFYRIVRDRAGRIDVLVANAGVGIAAPFGEVTEELIDSVFATNVKGTIFTLQQALPLLSDSASVILTGSTAATRPNPGLEVYAASKAAVRALARGWALSARAHGFRVNVVSPGGTRTGGLLDLITPEMLEQAEAAVSALFARVDQPRSQWRLDLKTPEGAVHEALVNLEARPAPAGEMTVVLGSGWPGILLHEAVGHGLEGDFNRKGSSVFSGRIGERVASKGVTVVDDGTIPDRRGSLNIDDEGNATQRNVLIEDGILRGYMQDTLNARLMKTAATGNGRRESFAHMTMPRMTNTYMRAGQHDPQEMIRSVKKGLYAVNFGGGQVDITSGKYVFSATEAYLIEDGRITTPVKGATLIGNGPETMQKVRMVGNDLALDEGVGICGKDGQSVPVGVGQPSLLIEGITVGGTQA